MVGKFFRLTVGLAFFLACLTNPVWATGASLYLNSPKEITVGQTFTVSILLNSSRPINATEVNLSFPNNKLEVTKVSTTGSFMTLLIREPSYTIDSVNFIGGAPNPGVSGKDILVGQITVLAKEAGTAQIEFGPSQVLANDGLGTELLEESLGTLISIKEQEPAKKQAPTPVKPVVVSIEPTTNVVDFVLSSSNLA